ncbi:hypothetical protein BGW80DRAFT_1329066 [Lactifluus volemus]|nr:hypothetical protein BGW80DRAFT_1329066 [Lactifluus volemus]
MLVDGPHFQATDEGELVFLLSDGDGSRRPTEHDIIEPEEEENSHRWRTEIAKYLAPLILIVPTMGRLPWTLADFPQGYVLLLHKSPRPRRRVSSSSVPRRDFYLYGATDVATFASPLEFVKHAEWLMRGAHRTLDTRRAPRCACTYCDYNGAERRQSVISRELRAARARVLALMNEEPEIDELEAAAPTNDVDDHGVNNSGADPHADAVAAEV